MRRSYPTDRLLWVIFALGLFIAFGFVDLLGSGHKGDYRLWAYIRMMWEGGYNTSALLVAAIVQGLLLAVPALAFGWLLQAVAVICGVRLSGRSDPAQAADYDDAPAAPPAS